MKRFILFVALINISLILTACQADIETSIFFQGNGVGTLSITASVDEELATLASQAPNNPLEVAKSRTDNLEGPWSAEVENNAAGQPSKVTLSSKFKSQEELVELYKELQRGLNSPDTAVIGDINMQDGEDQFTVSASLPFDISDSFAQEISGLDKATLLAQHGQAVSNTLVIDSSTEVVGANVQLTPKNPANPDDGQYLRITQTIGQPTLGAEVTFKNQKKNWWILAGGLFLAVVLFWWGNGVIRRARRLKAQKGYGRKPAKRNARRKNPNTRPQKQQRNRAQQQRPRRRQ